MPEEIDRKVTVNGEDHTFTMIVPTKEENLQSLKEYPLFIATVDYFATGEGSSQMVLVTRCKDKEEFIEFSKDKIDPYFMIGVEIYENTIPDDDSVINFLVSDDVKNTWKRILDGKIDSGYYEFFIKHYVNYS